MAGHRQESGDYEGTQIIGGTPGPDNSLIERKVLEPPEPVETTTRVVLRTGNEEDLIVDHPGQPADYAAADGTVWTWHQRWRLLGGDCEGGRIAGPVHVRVYDLLTPGAD